MANAGAAFGLEDVPDLPEHPRNSQVQPGLPSSLVKFMSWLHKRTYTKAARFQPSALADVADYLKWRAYGTTDVDFKDLEQNPTCRSSILTISFYMPIKGAHGMEPRQSNQVRSVNEVVKEVKKAETQHRGKKSCATRDLTKQSIIRTACMLKQQVHLITRTDDISKLKYSDYKPHPDFPFALSCKVHWSKNISEERQCPDQIILGSMDTDFCAMLGLANYMEASFNYGYGAAGREDAFLFTPESDPKLAPKHCNAAYRNILKAVFLSAPFCAGVLGSHSIRKFAATLARGMGATADEVDIRGRWKARLSGRVVDPWIDARVAEKLCMGLLLPTMTPDWLIEHVVPRTHAFYDGVNDISLHLALPLLWAALDESWEERMEPPVRVRIQDAYERIKADIPVASTLW
ncbi:unknown protein [Seminavis robusta]|uniref:Uncharacterized protein n=1 Tax=Seminavis robusta TaxID=568900 RepID=A0A9N8DRR2_9STRA|nr:unknown protein [Seminavis robusta]